MSSLPTSIRYFSQLLCTECCSSRFRIFDGPFSCLRTCCKPIYISIVVNSHSDHISERMSFRMLAEFVSLPAHEAFPCPESARRKSPDEGRHRRCNSERALCRHALQFPHLLRSYKGMMVDCNSSTWDLPSHLLFSSIRPVSLVSLRDLLVPTNSKI